MSSGAIARPIPLDQSERVRALDPDRSILVQAPAGSGKTDLLTRRFLRLLAQVDEPGQVVAITFTNAAAAEMRHRILAELEKAAEPRPAAAHLPAAATIPLRSRSRRPHPPAFLPLFDTLPSTNPEAAEPDGAAARELATADSPGAASLDEDIFSMDALARRAFANSHAHGWKLLDLPGQLRISTIDSFCRELALQQPLLSGLGGGLDIAPQPRELYRRAARQTLNRIGQSGSSLTPAIESLLLWRDNNWQEMENLLVAMLGQRDRWMHEFVVGAEPDMDALRERLERPFANAVQSSLTRLGRLLDQVPGACEEALLLARFACEQTGGNRHQDLAELPEFPRSPFSDVEALEQARRGYACLAELLLTSGAFRKSFNKNFGFPSDRKQEKARIVNLIERLKSIPGLEAALAATLNLPPARYAEDTWQIVRACFTLLRHAAAELQVVFAEAGGVDFIQIAQIAQQVLIGPDGLPSDAALAVADGILHLLVDEFQDTSRRQHALLAGIVGAWPDRIGRTVFAVGDPMQSIYFFRDAEAELFARVKAIGLEVPGAEPLQFDFAPLRANFRTAPELVDRLNDSFRQIFAHDDGSGVSFSPAEPCREAVSGASPRFKLHLNFPGQPTKNAATPIVVPPEPQAVQTAQIVALIQSYLPRVEEARRSGSKYRIAVLGRARSALAPVAQALREAAIPFRAVDLEKLAARPEVLDALALARALLNPMDRVAWLGVLRAPWCALSLEDLHRLTSADDPALFSRAVPELIAERAPLLSPDGRLAATRVLSILGSAPARRAALPAVSLGTWLQSVWQHLGGPACVDLAARANLDLLWDCLDRLPEGEQDLLGPALQIALDELTALPDPTVSGDSGVQLMTIHKSKGLEFEVVLVPDLQAGSAVTRGRMLSWLERGLAQPDDSGEITEFLIAPLQPKGADRGKTKAWVDRVYREREVQEMRRILYVAATRARDELHLFACPPCKEDADSSLTLAKPADSLLATAWPALEAEIQARFDKWKAAQPASPTAQAEDVALAAQAESNVLGVPPALRPTLLRRLPAGVAPTPALPSPGNPPHESTASALYARHEGGPLSRALGTAVHALLEELSRLRLASDWDAARENLHSFVPQIVAQIRAAGIDPARSAHLAEEALRHALAASHDPVGQWILAPHSQAESETAWTGVAQGALRTVRVDRIFRAGSDPHSEGSDFWWIVDYKTAHAPGAEFDLPRLRDLFAPQLEAYATLLRKLHGGRIPVRAGLYYPRMLKLDWWPIEL